MIVNCERYIIMNKTSISYFLAVVVILLIVVSCAKRGSPTGGPVDEDPPEILRVYPDNFSTNFKATEIEITFDEYVKLQDLQKQLVISPPLKNLPLITPQGSASKTVTIQITDTLKENTTYTFNFGQSIVDNNEGNPYPFYRYVFSTGTYIDSLQLKGKITDALDFKSEEFVNVMLYKMDSTYTDSIVFKEPPLYVFNTLDSLETFTMENLAAGTYRMIGLKEENSNLRFEPARDKIGFVSDPVTLPTDELYELQLYKPILDDEVVKATHEAKTRFYIGYKGRLDSMKVEPLIKDQFSKTRITKLKDKDTLQFWFLPELALEPDSVIIKASYKNYEEELTVRLKDLYQDSLTVSKYGAHKLGKPLQYDASTPMVGYDESKVELLNRDSIPVPVELSLDEFTNILSINFEQEEKELYRLKLFPGAITDFYGASNDTISNNYTTRETSSYGNMLVTLESGTQWPAIVQIVKEDLTVVAQQIATENKMYSFDNLDPGSYLVRVIYDANANGVYDPGNFLKNIQPEKVVYLPAVKQLLANWDLRETVILE